MVDAMASRAPPPPPPPPHGPIGTRLEECLQNAFRPDSLEVRNVSHTMFLRAALGSRRLHARVVTKSEGLSGSWAAQIWNLKYSRESRRYEPALVSAGAGFVSEAKARKGADAAAAERDRGVCCAAAAADTAMHVPVARRVLTAPRSRRRRTWWTMRGAGRARRCGRKRPRRGRPGGCASRTAPPSPRRRAR